MANLVSHVITINLTANIYRYPTGGSTIALAATSTIGGSVASGAVAVASLDCSPCMNIILLFWNHHLSNSAASATAVSGKLLVDPPWWIFYKFLSKYLRPQNLIPLLMSIIWNFIAIFMIAYWKEHMRR